MRAYLATNKEEILSFLEDGSLMPAVIYAPTIKFLTNNSELDEEEAEYEISLRAAHASDGHVLALEIPEALVDQHLEDTITVKGPLHWDFVQCLFVLSVDSEGDEELTWYATQEIKECLA